MQILLEPSAVRQCAAVAAPTAKAAAVAGGLFGLGAFGSVALVGALGLSSFAVYRYAKKQRRRPTTTRKPAAPAQAPASE